MFFVCKGMCGGQKRILGVGLVLSSSTLWVSGTELKSSGFVANTFSWLVTSWALPPVLMECARLLLEL